MTTLLLIRHAIAEEREIAAAAGIPDEQRALTAKGEKRMRQVAAALAGFVPELTLVATSPLRRAVQTAEIVAAACGKVPVVQTPALSPGADPEAVAQFLQARRLAGPCALVGHEPDLGQWLGWALCGTSCACAQFKKGGAALLTFPGLPTAGQGELLWLLTPAQLRDC